MLRGLDRSGILGQKNGEDVATEHRGQCGEGGGGVEEPLGFAPVTGISGEGIQQQASLR